MFHPSPRFLLRPAGTQRRSVAQGSRAYLVGALMSPKTAKLCNFTFKALIVRGLLSFQTELPSRSQVISV